MPDGLFTSYDSLSSYHCNCAIHETLRLFRKEKILLALVLVFTFGVGATVWKLSVVEEELVVSTAIQDSEAYARTLPSLHRIYASEVLEASRRQEVPATHDYDRRDGATPLPFAFNALLERDLARKTPGLRFLLYSDHPFPWRRRSPAFSETFSADALRRLASDSSTPYHRVEIHDGAPVLRYATALVMDVACIECHNTYPSSPRTDWRTGDLAGALEVVYPLEAAASATGDGLRNASQLVVGVILLGGFVMALVVSRLRRVSTDLNEEVEERTKELRASEERFEEISRSIEEVFWVYEVASGSILFVNHAFERVWGCSCESLLEDSKSWRDAIHPEDRDRVVRAFEEQAHSGAYHQEYRIVRPDGELRWIEDHAYPVRDAAGNVPRIVGIAEDITARKEAEAKEENLNDQLVDASRMAGMAEVATGVLHNVGNVLNSINVATLRAKELLGAGRTQRIRDAAALLRSVEVSELARFFDSTQGRAFAPYLARATEELVAEHRAIAAELNAIDGHVQHVVGVVAAQQTFARGAAYAEEVKLAELVDEAVRIEEASLLKREIQVVRDYQCFPTVVIDKHKVLQILVNLIGNAKHALEVQAAGTRRIRVRIRSTEAHVRIVVEDTGAGIASEHLERLFEYGFTTKKNGHGFGLHASANAAREIGGSLRAESAGPGRGASFCLQIPVHSREEESTCSS